MNRSACEANSGPRSPRRAGLLRARVTSRMVAEALRAGCSMVTGMGARGRLNSLHRPTNTGAKATENLFRSGDLTLGSVSQDRRTVVARLVGGSLRAPAQQRRDHEERRYGGAGACACRFNRCPEFFFTRMSDALFWRKVTIGHAT